MNTVGNSGPVAAKVHYDLAENNIQTSLKIFLQMDIYPTEVVHKMLWLQFYTTTSSQSKQCFTDKEMSYMTI